MEEYNKVQRLGENRNSMYWILYQTICLVNNKIYIGVHKTERPYEFDGYLGNGVYIHAPKSYIYANTAFEAAIKKYGPSSFRRTVLKVFTDEEAAYAAEAKLVDADFLKRSDVYNMILGGKIPYINKATTPIYQYSIDGALIKEFPSFQEAAKSIHRNPATLSDACANGYSCGGFYWSKMKQDKLDLSQYRKQLVSTKLYMYDLNGNYIKEFPSTQSTGYTQASMSATLGNIVDNKYRFCYVKASTYAEAKDIYLKQRHIYQYDSNGKYLKTWHYKDVIKAFPHDKLNQAIRHKTLTKSGYYWGLAKYEVYNEPVMKSQRKIGKYDLDNNLLTTYPNSATCYKENGKNVYKVLVGLRKSYKGHIYKYIE